MIRHKNRCCPLKIALLAPAIKLQQPPYLAVAIAGACCSDLPTETVGKSVDGQGVTAAKQHAP
ncbi:hypothetical protein RNAN_0535 [Rheinheimera nanhaiensis E407-8]|uniref:Uncharacterized protein n=1 Tax=Rheinheimera nanhaiensis E407-8 TaxID=562729 RepID=I1DU38_9GAMM|nr:hypothetical protein RNAN_0535 [Rheinheimera nanhaiensis E407-8]